MTDTKEFKEAKLWEAAERGDCATIRRLAMEGVDVNARNEEGYTAFNIATQNNHSQAAMALLAAKEMQYMRERGVAPEDYLRQSTEDRRKTA